jgi:hypothetical protein
MRVLILAAGALLGLSACGGGGQAENAATADQVLSAENIVTNDVTAIDAVTAEAANMAADVDINFTNEQLDRGGEPGSAARAPARGSKTGPSRTTPDRPAATSPATGPVPEENQAQNSAGEKL